MDIKLLEIYDKINDTLGEEIAIVDNTAYWGIQYKDEHIIKITLAYTDIGVVISIKIFFNDFTTIQINSYNKIYEILGYAYLKGITIEQ